MIVYFTFKIKQQEISKTICIQRKLVNNTCNGRCELQKSLKKLDQEKKSENSFKEKFELLYTSLSSEYKTIIIPILINKAQPIALYSKKAVGFCNSIFHPPTV